MATAKKRISIPVDDTTYYELKALSGKRQQKVPDVSLYLIQKALDLEEDMYFSKIADERLSQQQKRISHHKFWK